MRISDCSSDVCSSYLLKPPPTASVAARQSQIEPFLAESLTDELEPLILRQRDRAAVALALQRARRVLHIGLHQLADALVDRHQGPGALRVRSEEHTSELQSLMRISYAVFCLKKKTTQITNLYTITLTAISTN